MDPQIQDHLFISYAIEDRVLAKWLTLKLTAAGYRVWCDQFKLLGGESYPRDIDRALKEETFRVIALLSRFSMNKSNPRKERTLALNIGRERGCDFLIPLNVDGLKPTELDWMTNDLTFVPFHRGWADGLKQLFDRLSTISAPRSVPNGKLVAAETFLATDVLTTEPEVLTTNWLDVKRLPDNIYAHRLSARPTREHWRENFDLKKSYRIDPTTFLSFSPLLKLRDLHAKGIGTWDWRKCTEILGVNSRNLTSSLLRRHIYSDLEQKGLQSPDQGVSLYFPRGLLAQDRLQFIGPAGKPTWIRVAGNRTFKRGPELREECSYHLALKFTVRQDVFDPFIVQFKALLHLATSTGQPLKRYAANSRRKKITKSWFNDEWLKRNLAALAFAAGGAETWRIGENGTSSIEISSIPLKLLCPVGINEALLKPEIEEPADSEEAILALDDEDEEFENL